MSTFDIGLFNNSYTVTDAVSLASPDDLYNFTLASGGGLQASFTGMSSPLNWQVKDSGGSTLQSGLVSATNPDAINLYNLAAGNYSLQVSQVGGDTAYNLNFDPLTNFNFDSGFFTVGQTGQVGFDYLLDGGWYRGELAIFSMREIETFNPGSSGFIKEAARRALSNSTEGYVVISDPTEGAKLTATFPGEGNFNAGEYKGIKTFAMTPGDKFGILLVPNGTVQEVFDNPSIGGSKRPLFSLATANPNDAFHVGQIADVTKDAKTFAMEDLRYDLGSDKDYNDFVFRVTGARGFAIALDEVIDPQKDWRSTTVGTDLRNYVNTPPQFLQFKLNSSYRVGETVNLTDAKVFDENGDISKVVFKLKQADGSEVTNEINNFSFNEDWASFNYALSGLAAGSYELTAIASDQLGQVSNNFTQNFQVQRVNNAPIDLQFAIPQSTYNIGDSINFIGAKVYDADGISDLAKVDFEIKKDSGELIINQSVTNFTSDSGDNRWGNFSYSLSGLGVGSYELRAIASDNSGAFSNSVSQIFTVNAPVVVPPNTPPEFLQFSTLPSYNLGETVNLMGGKVYDANGFSDLRIVDFSLQKDGGDWENISDVTSFTADSTDNRWGNFNYALSGLGLGSYVVKATAYDQSSGSNTVTANFTINPVPDRAPEGLQFSILPLYTNDETIRFNGGKVFDSNGVGDIDKVDFWLGHPDGSWSNIADATQFTADSRGRGRFNYSYDLSGLAPGRYQLWAKAKDKSNNYGEPFSQYFSVITAAGESELADEERIAIANAANLNKYTPEELAKTREWVVWVTPGQSSTDLAQQIAAQDKGATGYIPNTYTWEFPEDISADEVTRRLNSVRGVELYYPLVPLEPELLSDPLVQQPSNLNPTYPLSNPNDPNLRNFLNSYQWHLRTGVNPSADANVTAAWNLAKGNGVVIGIVDDALDFSHPDLRDRYRADLSWDFNEYDENPSPSYNRTIFASGLPRPINDSSQTDFRLDVPLTGVVSDANVRLKIAHLRTSDLEALVDSPNDPVFNPLIGRGTLGNGRIIGGNGGDQYPVLLFDNVGGDGDNFTNTIFDDQADRWIYEGVAPFTGSFKPLGSLADFNQQWVQGWWNLRIKDEIDTEAGRLNYWGLELQTYNPHGTPVAGIAAASDNNGIGGSGVAPLASLAGLRLVADEVNDLQISGALSYERQNIDIYNNSWKLEDWLTKPPLALAVMRGGSNFGRATLGNIYVFGAGNDQWGGGNVNYNGFANSRYALPVAAIDHTGKQTIYSEPGASLLVSAYSSSSGVGITTTDLTGNNGYAATDYTYRFGGTSASAPFVSGVVALMLEANPTLSWRDVPHILVRTAKKNDPTDFDWKMNGAGYHINHKYGFGAVDAEAAVRLAQNWASVGNETMVSSGLQNVLENIPDGDEQTGVRSSILISDDITVEKVEVVFNTDHRDWRDLKVVLKSPDGTESILADSISSELNAENRYQLQPESSSWIFTSARDWGESSRGEWQLQVFDREGNQIQGEWNTWKLNLYGAKPTVTINATDASATESGDPGQFTVTRSGNTKYALTVNYSLAGNATNGTDYDALSGTVTIPAEQTSATINITTAGKDDAVYEGDESVIARLTPNNTYTVGTIQSPTVTIADNDLPTVTISILDTNAAEDGDSAQFIIARSGSTANPLTVNYSLAGNATNGLDYSTLSGSITIPAGAAMATLPIIPLADAEVEGNETVQISLTGSSAYNVGSDSSGTARIQNRIGTSQYGPFIYVNPANNHLYLLSQIDTWLGAQEQAKALGGNLVTINDVNENNWIVNTFGDSVFWMGLTDSPIYGATEGNFKWVSGEPVTYTNWHDAPRQPDNYNFTIPGGENFSYMMGFHAPGRWYDVPYDFTLLGAPTFPYPNNPGIIEIDPTTLAKPIVMIRATDANAKEDGNAGQLIVTRIGDTTNPLTVNYSVLGSAANGTDYQNLTGSITIPTGKSLATIPIIPIADNEVEGNETVAVQLLANNTYNVAATGNSVVTIANNTPPANPVIYTNPVTGNKYLLTTPDTWLGAQEQAAAAGGNLVTINDVAERDWLFQTFGSRSYWIGLNDSPIYGNQEGNFEWVSKEPVTYTNWWPDQPDSVLHTSEGEDFVEMNDGQNRRWNDLPHDLSVLGPTWQQNTLRGIVEIPFQNSRWNARFINRTALNVSDRNTYDFSNPAAVLDLGAQNQGRSDNGLRLYRDWDANPVSGVQDDNFAMEAWTRTQFEAGKLYKITTRSDDGTWFRLKNAQTGEWIGDSVVLGGDGADWRDRGITRPPRTIFFKVPESAQYDFYVQYYEKSANALIDINVEEAQVFQDPVNESQQWNSTVFWWDRKQGNVPPGDFYNNQNNIIGVISQGSNTRSDGKKGINFNFPELEALSNDTRLPDNNYAIRSYTQTYLESGVKYRARVRGDDGFQLLAKRANTDQWVYITPKDQWQQAYGVARQIDFTVPQDGMYDMHFHHYEERGDAYLDFSWEVVPFSGTVLATAGANIRSAPNTSQAPVGFLNYRTPVTFDKWTRGQFVDYRAELGTSSDIWYRIAGTNNWISAAIIDGNP